MRTYSSLLDAAIEVADSRVFGGVHFNKSGVDGLSLGINVAKLILKSIPVPK